MRTAGVLVTSSVMRYRALGRQKSYKERMKYQQPIQGLFVIKTRYMGDMTKCQPGDDVMGLLII